jgi:1-acyl-sn-glycerol-3-phosphate acyltransferase
MEPDQLSARGRFAALWLSQAARVMADNCLRVFVVLEVARGGAAARDAAWHLATAFLAVPAIFLSPLYGVLCNSLPKRAVLAGAAAYCLAVVLFFGWTGGPWLACWGLVAVGALVYSPARYALLPAAAQDTGIPLTRINGWIEMGAVVSLVTGMLLGVQLHETYLERVPSAVVVAATLGLASVGLALPVRFPSDVWRPEPPVAAVAGFFRDFGRVWRLPAARNSVAGLAVLRGLVTAMVGAIVACVLALPGESGDVASVDELVRAGAWVLVGVAAGSVVAGIQGHPYRCLGLVPIGAIGLTVGLTVAASWAAVSVPSWLCVLLGVMGGLANVPLAATYQATVPADARGNAMAVRNLAEYACMAATSVAFFVLARSQVLTPSGQLWLLAGLSAVGMVVAVRGLLRPLLEQTMEVLIWPMYRIRVHGPGAGAFPRQGPVVIVANHSSYFDPIWAAKVTPRPLFPMMTSVFYDLPILRWLMINVVQAIRVQAATFRREVPELDEAWAVLDRGQCLVVFPEGMLRRKEDLPLRHFAQGVWRILRDRPDTPVVVMWIEGGWGSFFSYRWGAPCKNKPMDRWRRIDIAVTEPVVLDPAVLADRRATRHYLMQRCLGARRHLGLEPLQLPDLQDEEVGKA